MLNALHAIVRANLDLVYLIIQNLNRVVQTYLSFLCDIIIRLLYIILITSLQIIQKVCFATFHQRQYLINFDSGSELQSIMVI